MTLKTPINVALIGFGFSGSTFHAPFLSTFEDYNLCCVVSSNPKKVQESLSHVRVESDFTKVLKDPTLDLIVIATPNSTHYELAKAALESGKHVVIDKPFTIYSSEAQNLIEIAKRQKRILTVYQNRRWDGDFLTIKKLLAEKVLGEVYLYEAHFHRYRPLPNPQRWKEAPERGSGILYDLGSHLLDQALHLFGSPDSINADIITQRPGAIADDYFHLTLKYGTKRVILKASNLVCNPGPRYQIHGTQGSFLKTGMDPQEQDLITRKSPLNKMWGQGTVENDGILSIKDTHSRILTIPGNYGAFYTSLAKAIYNKSTPPVLAEESYQVMRLIEKCWGEIPEEISHLKNL
ncbi:MAG: oxidoreductase [Alphaproteobacteria bacterium]|nr:oxidoreductase [Alphaproteobacteria bacterium]